MANFNGSNTPGSNLLREGAGSNVLAQLLGKVQNTYGDKLAVATLASVSEVLQTWNGKYGRVAVTPVPRWDKDATNYIEGYFFSEQTISEGQLVLIVFTDTDFRTIINTGTWLPEKTENKNTHSRDFGVIVKL